jgi:hypothetical protein
MTSGFEYLTQGQFLLSFFAPFEAIGIPAELMYLIFIFILNGLIYIRTRDPRVIGMTLMLTAYSFLGVIRPGMEIYFYAIIIGGLALAIYNIFVPRR